MRTTMIDHPLKDQGTPLKHAWNQKSSEMILTFTANQETISYMKKRQLLHFEQTIRDIQLISTDQCNLVFQLVVDM